jgi:hypothetical protein
MAPQGDIGLCRRLADVSRAQYRFGSWTQWRPTQLPLSAQSGIVGCAGRGAELSMTLRLSSSETRARFFATVGRHARAVRREITETDGARRGLPAPLIAAQRSIGIGSADTDQHHHHHYHHHLPVGAMIAAGAGDFRASSGAWRRRLRRLCRIFPLPGIADCRILLS